MITILVAKKKKKDLDSSGPVPDGQPGLSEEVEFQFTRCHYPGVSGSHIMNCTYVQRKEVLWLWSCCVTLLDLSCRLERKEETTHLLIFDRTYISMRERKGMSLEIIEPIIK